MRRTHNSISWLEIIIVNLAALLAIGAMGASQRAPTNDSAPNRPVLVASR